MEKQIEKGLATNASVRKLRILTILSFIAGTVALHYGTPHHLMYLHVLLQTFFFLPVFLSGWWFGKKAGILAAIVIFSVYIHHAVTVMMPSAEMAVGNGVQIILFFIVGALTGTYKDMRTSYLRATRGAEAYPVATFPAKQKLLVYLDDSGASMNAVRYVAQLFSGNPDIGISFLKVLNTPNAETTTPNSSSQKGMPEESPASASPDVTLEARALLINSGFPEANIATRVVERGDARISDMLLAEQESGGYSAIVVGRHRLTRTEEFLFGSVAIRLARQANCPVWVVGDASTAEVSLKTADP